MPLEVASRYADWDERIVRTEIEAFGPGGAERES